MIQLCNNNNVADLRWAQHGGFVLYVSTGSGCFVPGLKSVWKRFNGETRVTKALGQRSAPNVSTHIQIVLGTGKVFGGLFVKKQNFYEQLSLPK